MKHIYLLQRKFQSPLVQFLYTCFRVDYTEGKVDCCVPLGSQTT